MRQLHRKGFTLVELMITVAIIAVLSATGWAMMSDLLPRYRAYQGARDFAMNFTSIRGMAATLTREHRVCLLDYDSSLSDAEAGNVGEYATQVGNRSVESTSWEWAPGDRMSDGSDDDTTEGLVDFGEDGAQELADVSLNAWATISGPSYPGTSNSDCIVVGPRGFVVNPNGDFDTEGYITVEFVNKQAYAKGNTEIYQVKISRAGMVRLDFNDSLYSSVAGNPSGLDGESAHSNTSSGGGGGE